MRKIYVDMDGVLAKWRPECSIEDIYEEDYFLNLEPEPEIIKACKLLKENDVDIEVLSCSVSVRASWEKEQWLQKNGLSSLHAIFVPYGDDKGRYVDEDNAILIDDFGKNLKTWKGIPVKFYNGINGHGNTSYNYVLFNAWDAATIAKELISIVVDPDAKNGCN